MHIEEIDLDEWDRLLPATGFEVFHRAATLRVLDEHSDSELRLYGAFKGQEPVGLIPLFVRRNRLGTAVTSPPPSMGIPRLGPLVMSNSPKQRKREKVNQTFVDELIDETGVDASRTLFHLECPLSYTDPRPFDWAGMDVRQQFTYVLDLADTTAEEVSAGFSSDLRKEIRRAEDTDMTVSVEGTEAAMEIYDEIEARFDEQGEQFDLSASQFHDLVDALGERCRVYVARDPSDRYLGGIVVPYSNDTASYWQGGVRNEYQDVSVNSTLHWAVISDIIDGEGPDVDGYDLVGANTPRLCQYKGKFGADLRPYYTVESAGVEMAVAKRAYRMVSR